MNQRSYNALVQIAYGKQFHGFTYGDTLKLWKPLLQRGADFKACRAELDSLDYLISVVDEMVWSWLDKAYINTIEYSIVLLVIHSVKFRGMSKADAKVIYGKAAALFGDNSVKGFILSLIDKNL